MHMVYAWNIYPLDVTNFVCYFSKNRELFLFPYNLSLEQLLILQLNKNDKRKHHGIMKNLYFTIKKFDAVG